MAWPKEQNGRVYKLLKWKVENKESSYLTTYLPKLVTVTVVTVATVVTVLTALFRCYTL